MSKDCAELQGRAPRAEYVLALVAGVGTASASIGIALLGNVGPNPFFTQLEGAAFAWGIGGGTVLWALPAVKRLFGWDGDSDE